MENLNNDYILSLTTNTGVKEILIPSEEKIKNKQDKLISGQNIATINNQDITQGGNIEIQGGSSSTPEVIITSEILEVGKIDVNTSSKIFDQNAIISLEYDASTILRGEIKAKTVNESGDSIKVNFIVDSPYDTSIIYLHISRAKGPNMDGTSTCTFTTTIYWSDYAYGFDQTENNTSFDDYFTYTNQEFATDAVIPTLWEKKTIDNKRVDIIEQILYAKPGTIIKAHWSGLSGGTWEPFDIETKSIKLFRKKRGGYDSIIIIDNVTQQYYGEHSWNTNLRITGECIRYITGQLQSKTNIFNY